MNKNDFQKTFSAPGSSLDIVGLSKLNEKIQNIKAKPKEDALENLLEVKSSIEEFIKLAPPMKEMLNPYLIKLNVGISELIQLKQNEK